MRKKVLLATFLSGIFCLLVNISSSSAYDLIFTTQDFPPFSYQMGSYVAGPAADIIRAVCMDTDLKCAIYSKEWSNAQMDVKKGKAHGMFMIGWNKNRSSWLHFSHPILKTEYGLFVRKSNLLNYNTSTDIKGYNVGVYGPSNTSQSLLKIKKVIKDLRVDFSPDSATCFQKLSQGLLDAVYSNKAVGRSLINRLGLKNIRYAGRDKSLEYYYGFNQKYSDKATIDKFNKCFEKFHKNGVIHEVLSMYGMELAEIK
ncbi:MAG: transporter substrate-binding domain-containing protein [Candidatus Magnetomorum sp.]|nr:transporter substrate-binding domain-containing protein [Candidatus Magnetomorum sp.]